MVPDMHGVKENIIPSGILQLINKRKSQFDTYNHSDVLGDSEFFSELGLSVSNFELPSIDYLMGAFNKKYPKSGVKF